MPAEQYARVSLKKEMLNPNKALSVIVPETTLKCIDSVPYRLVNKTTDIALLACVHTRLAQTKP